MEYLGEALALGLDSLILGICLKQYFHCQKSMKALKGAEVYDINDQLKSIVQERVDNKIDYVALRGTILAIGKPLYGVNDKSISGVVQKLSVKEHVVARTSVGFWYDQERTIQEAYHTVPFVLKNGRQSIEILEPLSAEILDMDVISDEFKPSAPTLTDYLWTFFAGVRQSGLQSTEEMLREGVTITAIGELSSSPESPDKLVLQPPLNTPFYLTTMSVGSLIRKLDESRRIYRYLCLMFGAIGLVMGGIIIRKYWRDREDQRLSEQLRRSLAESRKERRQRVREKDLREDQLCVVCRTNPKEIILLPCGHVCLCEDCSDGIDNDCPMCRGPIEQKAAAYII